jgi:hypothetical protein
LLKIPFYPIFQYEPEDKTMMLLIAGIVLIVCGSIGLILKIQEIKEITNVLHSRRSAPTAGSGFLAKIRSKTRIFLKKNSVQGRISGQRVP